MYDLEKIYEVIENEIIESFMAGEPHQPWDLIPRNKFLNFWKRYSKYGTCETNRDFIEIEFYIILCAARLLYNSTVHSGDAWFLYDIDEDGNETTIRDATWEEWYKFTDDGSRTCLGHRSFVEVVCRGNARYTDRQNVLGRYVQKLVDAECVHVRLMYMSAIINIIHGIGSLAKWFVEGGVSTLDKVEQWCPKGIMFRVG